MTRIDQGQREAAAVRKIHNMTAPTRYGLHWLVGFEVSESA
ncbi:hypothetical protein ACQEVZ_08330 [Dactylosporangium sp. CA-152071]